MSKREDLKSNDIWPILMSLEKSVQGLLTYVCCGQWSTGHTTLRPADVTSGH